MARFCKLAEGKKFGLICFPRICFPLGLIYCDQEPLWLLNVIELLTRCKICFTLGLFANYFSRMGGGGSDFSLKSLSLSLKTHMNQPALRQIAPIASRYSPLIAMERRKRFCYNQSQLTLRFFSLALSMFCW